MQAARQPSLSGYAIEVKTFMKLLPRDVDVEMSKLGLEEEGSPLEVSSGRPVGHPLRFHVWIMSRSNQDLIVIPFTCKMLVSSIVVAAQHHILTEEE